MATKKRNGARILTISPNTAGFGFAVLEGPNRLVEWASVRIQGDKRDACIARVSRLIERYRPDVLLTEHPNKSPQRGHRVRLLLADLLLLATERRIRRHGVPRDGMRRYFAKLNADTKLEIATVIAERFPELQPRLPRVRKAWMSEDSRMAIFDAVALALTWVAS